MLKLTFLGTSAGVPTKQRNVTALAVECLNPYSSNQKQNKLELRSSKSRPWLLIDCGEGTQQQLLHTKLSLNQLAAICITHVHGDHCYGLPGLLASAAMSGRTAPITLIAPAAIAQLLNAVKATTELYLPFNIDFIAIETLLSDVNKQSKITLYIDGHQQLEIDVTQLSHRVASHAFGITQTLNHRVLDTDKLRAKNIPAGSLWGKLQQGEDVYSEQEELLLAKDYLQTEQFRARIVVAGDNDTPACLTSAIQDTDLLVHEATYTTKVLTKIQANNKSLYFDPMHSSAEKIAEFAKASGLDNLILTHFSARYQNFDNPESSTANMSHIRLEAQKFYQGNLWLAEDFAQYLLEGKLTFANNTNADTYGKTEAKANAAISAKSRVKYLGSALSQTET